jgi:phosphoenolpyruvate carboxykinase (ATP)
MKYAGLLAEKIARHGSNVWLVNTGWSGGSYGVGKRMKLSLTRAIIDAIHSGALASVRTLPDPVFGIGIVTECPGVPRDVLTPRETWADKSAYDATAKKLAKLFIDNFKQYESEVSTEVNAVSPRI